MLSAVFVALISKRRRLTAVYVSFFVTFVVHILLVRFLSFREGTRNPSTKGTFDTKNSIRIRNVRRELCLCRLTDVVWNVINAYKI